MPFTYLIKIIDTNIRVYKREPEVPKRRNERYS